jgi:glycosyltransferase involved in cell wall biosynthesis
MRLLNLAPHCTLPPMDGADRRAWHLHESMIAAGVDGRFMGRHAIWDREKLTSLPVEAGWGDRKAVLALSALLTGRDYWQCKMLTPAFRHALADLRANDFQATIVHFLYALPLLRRWRGERMRLIIETHNYDVAVYDALRKASRNPLFRLLCTRAVKNSLAALRVLPRETTLVHVSEADSIAYQGIRPDLNHVVIENGCRVAPRASVPDYTVGEKQLLFVGSLSAQMNQDALAYLSTAFWPSLRGFARMCVAGSHPTPAVTALCAEQGWELRSNISDAELAELYGAAHYAVAPFAYGAGSKLKLMEACGRGVPILTTRAGATGLASTPPYIYVSDESGDWRRIVRGGPPTAEALRETLKFAEQVSWPHLGARLAKIIEHINVVKIP